MRYKILCIKLGTKSVPANPACAYEVSCIMTWHQGIRVKFSNFWGFFLASHEWISKRCKNWWIKVLIWTFLCLPEANFYYLLRFSNHGASTWSAYENFNINASHYFQWLTSMSGLRRTIRKYGDEHYIIKATAVSLSSLSTEKQFPNWHKTILEGYVLANRNSWEILYHLQIYESIALYIKIRRTSKKWYGNSLLSRIRLRRGIRGSEVPGKFLGSLL